MGRRYKPAFAQEYRKIVNQTGGIQYMQTELGHGADAKIVNLVTNTILPELQGELPIPPIPYVILIAGHPGAGKTTLSNEIAECISANVIHSDRIRYELNQLGKQNLGPGNAEVNAIRNQLMKAICATGQHIILDQFMNPLRAGITGTIARQINSNYRTLTLFLNTPYDTLVERLTARTATTGFHTGTLEHLQTFKGQFWEAEPDAFDLVFKDEDLHTMCNQVTQKIQN